MMRAAQRELCVPASHSSSRPSATKDSGTWRRSMSIKEEGNVGGRTVRADDLADAARRVFVSYILRHGTTSTDNVVDGLPVADQDHRWIGAVPSPARRPGGRDKEGRRAWTS
jgi:hypothetical protein